MRPFTPAIDALIERRLAASLATSLIAIHSFTRVFGEIIRPWEVGIIFDRHRALPTSWSPAFERRASTSA